MSNWLQQLQQMLGNKNLGNAGAKAQGGSEALNKMLAPGALGSGGTADIQQDLAQLTGEIWQKRADYRRRRGGGHPVVEQIQTACA